MSRGTGAGTGLSEPHGLGLRGFLFASRPLGADDPIAHVLQVTLPPSDFLFAHVGLNVKKKKAIEEVYMYDVSRITRSSRTMSFDDILLISLTAGGDFQLFIKKIFTKYVSYI